MSENLFIPSAVFTSGLSPRARLLLLDFTNLAVDNYLFPSQAVFAKDYGCSKTSIGRAIKELIKAGLLVDAGDRDKQRRKKYGLAVIPGLTRDPEIPHQVRDDKTEILGANANTEEEYF